MLAVNVRVRGVGTLSEECAPRYYIAKTTQCESEFDASVNGEGITDISALAQWLVIPEVLGMMLHTVCVSSGEVGSDDKEVVFLQRWGGHSFKGTEQELGTEGQQGSFISSHALDRSQITCSLGELCVIVMQDEPRWTPSGKGIGHRPIGENPARTSEITITVDQRASSVHSQGKSGSNIQQEAVLDKVQLCVPQLSPQTVGR